MANFSSILINYYSKRAMINSKDKQSSDPATVEKLKEGELSVSYDQIRSSLDLVVV